jgi:hypothetical protein
MGVDGPDGVGNSARCDACSASRVSVPTQAGHSQGDMNDSTLLRVRGHMPPAPVIVGPWDLRRLSSSFRRFAASSGFLCSSGWQAALSSRSCREGGREGGRLLV